MKVFAMIDTFQVSGPCRGLFQVVEQTKEAGVQFVLGMFLVRTSVFSPAIEEGKRRGVEVALLSQKRRYDPWLILQAWKAVRAHKVTIVQSHGYKPAFLAWCLNHLTGVPWIAFSHGYTSENFRISLYNRLDRWLMRRADRVVVVSEAMAHFFRNHRVPRERIRVIRNAINPADYQLGKDGREFRRTCGVEQEEVLIGVIGRLSPEKGQAVFVRAFQEVARVVPAARAVIVGEGQELERLQSAVKTAGLESRVMFAGYHAEMSEIYSALDLVVIPSLSEGLPNVLLEAMLHRKAVVATRVGGIPEVMQDGYSKFLVQPGDAGVLAEAIIQALRDPALRAELGEAGAKYVREAFGPLQRAEQIVKLYKELLSVRRASAQPS